MLSERHCQRRLRNTRSITYFAHKEIIARKQTLLQRRRRYHVILEKEKIDKVNGNQCEHQCVYPTHKETYWPFGILPPLPANLLCYINIKNERDYYKS